MKNEATATGWRELGDENGLVIHMRFGGSVACRTRGARAASTSRKEVNCVKCQVVIKRITGK